MKSAEDSSDESSDSSILETMSFGGVLSTAAAEDQNDESVGMEGLDLACRRVRFAQEALQHGQGKRHNLAKERISVIADDLFDDHGARSPPLRTGPPSSAGQEPQALMISCRSRVSTLPARPST